MTTRFHRPAAALPIPADVAGLLGFLVFVVAAMSVASDRFLTAGTFVSIAFQLPELGLFTLAMLMPLISGGFNLAVTFTANIAGLAMAWVIQSHGGVDAGIGTIALGMLAALATGAAAGWLIGAVIAHTGASPILVSLSAMIFLRGLGEFLTRGGDISGFPPLVRTMGNGLWLGVPVPLWIFAVCALGWHVLMTYSRLGFVTRMIGSNVEATRYSGIATARAITRVYMLSGLMCGVAGIVMLSRFNSVRVGHGEAFLLISVLACFLGRVDPFGGFGRVVPVVIALLILQVIASGLNLLGASQHLATALWGAFLLAVMLIRWAWAHGVDASIRRLRAGFRARRPGTPSTKGE
ncbi:MULTISPECIES: ABC transporter permease [Burkholderia]|uniref:ABC transporter permease n=1 Tax=Burkholderia TaxID=32008 RepID=UPI000CFFBF3B|nr:ABC transporter permease [Burkholderia multivorans]MBJ9655714.1 ABC transporter permease [Burkholderia multivorans]MBR8046164.1 ABC transporter permease [Burkholderia multivorans]MCA8222277.1 ABC transporter permease [Burkholderia multivorans]MDR8874062.1 Autoinducer 2 import system permease protein LsrD [Burkholderia multivorans]MDR8880596.1 Autoinducer 2 import system permease protein LsrD [Burkholderia multivorans]